MQHMVSIKHSSKQKSLAAAEIFADFLYKVTDYQVCGNRPQAELLIGAVKRGNVIG